MMTMMMMMMAINDDDDDDVPVERMQVTPPGNEFRASLSGSCLKAKIIKTIQKNKRIK